MKYYPTQFAHWSGVNNQVVLLDLQSSEFLALNKTSSQMWMMLSEGKTPQEISDELVVRFRIERSRVDADIEEFINSMQTRNLLSLTPSKPSLRQTKYLRWPKVLLSIGICVWLEAWATLRAVEGSMKPGCDSFLRLSQYIASLPASCGVKPGDKEVDHLASIVKQVASWATFKAACLHQYLTLCWMLRRRQVDVELVIGCYTHPFMAHVWIQCHDEVIHWKNGMGSYADRRMIEDMSVIFHSSSLSLCGTVT